MSKNRLTILALTLILSLLAAAAACVPTTEGQDNSSIYPLIIFMVLIFAAFYFLSIRPQRKRAKQQQDMLANLQRGDNVMTAGGIYGQIESIDEQTVVLKLESGATMRIVRQAVVSKRGE